MTSTKITSNYHLNRILKFLEHRIKRKIFLQGNEPRKAIAVVTGPTVRGNITFIQNGKRVIIVGRVTGLTKGLHGFHIHEKGDLSNGCASTGSHFNPDSVRNSKSFNKEHHPCSSKTS